MKNAAGDPADTTDSVLVCGKILSLVIVILAVLVVGVSVSVLLSLC